MDAVQASYCLRAPHNATSVIGDPAEFRGEELLAGVAARTEPSDGEYEKHLRAEPQDLTDGGNFTRLPRAKQKERRGIRESGHARRDTVERSGRIFTRREIAEN